MLDKNRKPLIHLPPTEGFSYAERMMFKKSEEMSKNIPIIVIPEEAGDLRNEVQNVADEQGVEVAIIGMIEGKRDINFNLMAANLVLSTTINNFKQDITIIDNEEYSESKGNLFKFTNPDLFIGAEPTIATQEDFYNPIFKDKDFSKPKKERAKNNRKKKKHKKAKNGR